MPGNTCEYFRSTRDSWFIGDSMVICLGNNKIRELGNFAEMVRLNNVTPLHLQHGFRFDFCVYGLTISLENIGLWLGYLIGMVKNHCFWDPLKIHFAHLFFNQTVFQKSKCPKDCLSGPNPSKWWYARPKWPDGGSLDNCLNHKCLVTLTIFNNIELKLKKSLRM